MQAGIFQDVDTLPSATRCWRQGRGVLNNVPSKFTIVVTIAKTTSNNQKGNTVTVELLHLRHTQFDLRSRCGSYSDGGLYGLVSSTVGQS